MPASRAAGSNAQQDPGEIFGEDSQEKADADACALADAVVAFLAAAGTPAAGSEVSEGIWRDEATR